MEQESYNILYLSSWYPTKIEDDLGNFVEKLAHAQSGLDRITVLHAVADDAMKEEEFRIEKNERGNLREIILYYGKARKGFIFLRKYRRWRMLRQHYLFGLNKATEWSGKFDLIHLHVIWPVGLVALLFRRLLKIPLVVTEHWTGYLPEDGRYSGRILKYLSRNTVRKAAAVITVSNALRDAMQARALRGNYKVIPNVVDTSVFYPGIRPEKIVFVHISSMYDRQKNVSGILKAFMTARTRIPGAELLIVGSGPDESQFKRMSNEMGLTGRGVTFLGKKSPEEVADILRKSSVLVMNSRFETQGVVVLEAYACGLPVILPRIGGFEELVDDSRGILFEPESEDGLVNAMVTISQSLDKYSSSEIRDFAFLNFSNESVARKTRDLYREVLKDG